MTRLMRLVCAVLFVTSPAVASHIAARLSIIDLGTLPGGTFSEAYALNDHGQVVGRAGTASGTIHAVLWQDGTMIDLGSLPGEGPFGGGYSEAYGINKRGQVVGMSFTGGPGCDPGSFSSCSHAFLWDGGIMRDLGVLGGPSSTALAINDRGQAVGLSSTASGEYHAVIWTDGVMIDLGTLPGDNFAQANAINNRSQVVGWSSGATTTTRAFYWENGTMSELNTLPSGSFSLAFDINKHGQIFGVGDDAGTRPPIRWDGERITNLGILSGAYYGQVGRSNDRGQVVGLNVYYPSEVVIPILWDQGRITELPSLPTPRNQTNFTAAADINNHGRIAGVSNGHAVIWVPR
jgi:probable HAF family extracellular repeat protein